MRLFSLSFRSTCVCLIALATHLPISVRAAEAQGTHTRRTPPVIMIVGGMTNGGRPAEETQSVPQGLSSSHAAPAAEAARRSVVMRPDVSPIAATTSQASQSVATRVAALSPLINEIAHIADMDSALLMAVIDVESGGNPQAVSPKGATGLMQLMPLTGARHGASDLFDSRQNIAAGARYLKSLMRRFGELPLALAAYNAGEGAVEKYGGQIPPYAETMSYVPRVIARYEWYRGTTSSRGVAMEQTVPDSVRRRFLLVGSGGAD